MTTMQRVRIKMCGLRRHEDVVQAVAAGADALGFVFYPPSPRHVTVELAARLVADVPMFVTSVALFMNPTVDDVQQVITQVRPNVLQFHGDETAEFCQQFGLPYIKAVPMGDAATVDAGQQLIQQYAQQFATASALLLDSHTLTTAGGSGKRFIWAAADIACTKPLITAGGLTIENVDEAIRITKPYAVDVSSGIEQEKGVKDAQKMQLFARNVNGMS